ncbi:ATP synthase subunit I [Oceanobacillus bengalensis]|uniref:ATP synthase subunit I n=1 Tax=Oceanobacillus bengalensis TaxID=1435466 RepID=A0A494YYU4_9BACI|nr:ATP synthase subunit I [Oceanobacillus bengalensis]RKQ15364.1 ATP synthase subunit I [Oceanobacillus bengalensis]
MSEYDLMVRRQRKWMLYLLAIFVVGVGFTSYTRIFYGLLLGTTVSFYNLWLLQHKTKAFGKAVAEQGKARGGLGTFSRLAAAVLAVLIALRFEETFHIIAVVIGIVTSYFVLALDGIVQFITHSKKKQNIPNDN